MFNLIRAAFLTLVNAYRPLFGRPERLAGLIIRPVLVALLLIVGIVPFAQQFILQGLGPRPMPTAPVVERLAHQLPVFAADMLAIIPWLWLASFLMMTWPHVRRSITPQPTSSVVGLQGKIWRATALMFGVLSVTVLVFEIYAQTMEYLDASSDSFHHDMEGSPGGAIGLLSLILLARYGLVFHGLSIGHPMSFRQSGQRLAGRSYRLFWSLLVVGSAAAYSPISPDRSWFTSVSPVWRSGHTAPPTGSFFQSEPGAIVSVFMFAFAVCAISEVIARTYGATATQPMKSPDTVVSAPA